MSRFEDLTGRKFNMLSVAEFVGMKSHSSQWRCVCDCGNSVVVGRNNLVNGHTKSCGCLKHKEAANKTHGQSTTRLYYVWRNMLNRCYNEKVMDFPNYGGRGIEVCQEWKGSFQTFSDWAFANGYDSTAKRGEYTLDRIETDGNYEPSNCRWATEKEQANNKRNNQIFEYNGETLTLQQLSEVSGIPYKTLHKRIVVLGWDAVRAANTKLRSHNRRKAGE